MHQDMAISRGVDGVDGGEGVGGGAGVGVYPP
jgi:hypothetical protein